MAVKTKKENKKTSSKKNKEESIIETSVEEVLTPHKQTFLDMLGRMFLDSRSIGHLLFNGIFRLPANKRLYEFTDEEIIAAFSTQLDIMSRKHEKSISEEKKREKSRQVLE